MPYCYGTYIVRSSNNSNLWLMGYVCTAVLWHFLLWSGHRQTAWRKGRGGTYRFYVYACLSCYDALYIQYVCGALKCFAFCLTVCQDPPVAERVFSESFMACSSRNNNVCMTILIVCMYRTHHLLSEDKFILSTESCNCPNVEHSLEGGWKRAEHMAHDMIADVNSWSTGW